MIKTLAGLMIAANIVFTATAASAAVEGGPKGGRLLENTEPRAEIFVEKDRSITVTFYDAALKPIGAAEQVVSVIAADAAGKKTVLDFEKKSDVLVSQGALPNEHALNLVIRFKATPNERPRNFRFVYEDHICNECQRAEYACICGH